MAIIKVVLKVIVIIILTILLFTAIGIILNIISTTPEQRNRFPDSVEVSPVTLQSVSSPPPILSKLSSTLLPSTMTSTLSSSTLSSRLSTTSSSVESSSSASSKPPSLSSFQPLCDKTYEVSHENSTLLVIPRRAYYDNRKAWKKGSGNVIIVLTEMSELAFESILACEINGYYTSLYLNIKEDTRWVRAHHKGFTYSLVFIECINVPSDALINGSSVKLIHKLKDDNCYSRVESENGLVVKHDGFQPSERGPDSVVVCVALFGRPPYLNEWLKYQKYLGIDMVHIVADKSFSQNVTSAYPFLKEALNTGFVRMEEWKNPLGMKMYYYSQLIKYQDCVMQYLGVFQYAFMLDSDDFFNPIMPNHKTLNFYTNKYFSNRMIATVCIKWLNYGCRPHLSRSPDNGNLTATLDDYRIMWKLSGGSKCVHRLDGLLFVGIHNAFMLVEGYKSVHGDNNLAYVAHIRPREDC